MNRSMSEYLGTRIFDGSVEEAQVLVKNNELADRVMRRKSYKYTHDTKDLSKEWKPSEFRSSRSERKKHTEQNISEFMDEYDFEVGAGSTVKIKVVSKFAIGRFNGKASVVPAGGDASTSLSEVLVDHLKNELSTAHSETLGKQLLRCMYWREGKALGKRRMKRPPRHIELALKEMKRNEMQHQEETVSTASIEAAATNSMEVGLPPLEITEYLKLIDEEENRLRSIAANDKRLEEDALRLLEVKVDDRCVGCPPKQSLHSMINSVGNKGVMYRRKEEEKSMLSRSVLGPVEGWEEEEAHSYPVKSREYFDTVMSSGESSADEENDVETVQHVDPMHPTLNHSTMRCTDGRLPLRGFVLEEKDSLSKQSGHGLQIPEWFDGSMIEMEEDGIEATKEMQQLEEHFNSLKKLGGGTNKLSAKHRSFLFGEVSNEKNETEKSLGSAGRGEKRQWKDMSGEAKQKAFGELFASKRSYVLGETQELEGSRAFQRPFEAEPSKQRRYEQFIKNKEKRDAVDDVMDINSNELLEFERVYASFKKPKEADEVIAKEVIKTPPLSTQEVYIRRAFYWRPSKLLCRRWNISDPWARKEFPEENTIQKKEGIAMAAPTPKLPAFTSTGEDTLAATDIPARPPIGLFKAIFESDEDEDT